MPVLSGQSRADERCAMKCPFCGAPDTKVIDSRLAAGGNGVRRRRECLSCRERFTTFETAELVMPKVIKKDGSREPFSDEKIRGGFMEALHKRPVSVEDIERALMQLKLRIRGTGEREIPSSVIGDFVMESLKELDPVAYIRFASVYRSFKDIHDFNDTLEKLARQQEEREKAKKAGGAKGSPDK